jgi:hypothetical protein
MLTTRVPFQPSSGVQKEVSADCIDTDEVISGLLVADMPMISLARLIVVSHDANLIDDQRQPILEIVGAAANRLGQAPDNNLDFRTVVDAEPLAVYFNRTDHITSPKVM